MRKSFTIIEILTVVGILTILFGISVGVYYLFFKKNIVEIDAERIANILRLAQTKSVASKNLTNFGVHFDSASSTFILFSGSNFNPAAPDNEVYFLDKSVYFDSINLNGPSIDVVFERLFGQTENYGNIVIKSRRNSSWQKIIYVYHTGFISFVSEPFSSSGRIFDSRHVHFNLGWSIQNATVLTLIFHKPGYPDYRRDITMSSYFDPNKTSFSWEGETIVFGESQILKIHTHFLDATNTILSIHRDRELNSKAVDILIDDKGIANYDADGNVFIGPFGGVLEIQ